MARDYKNSGSSSPRRASPKKRPPAKGRGAAQQTPGWVWLLTGLSVGLLVALGVYLYNRNHEITQEKAAAQAQSTTSTQQENKTKPAPKKPAAVEPPKEEEPRFDFYTLLPNQEVVIPEGEILEEQQKLEAKNTVIYTLQAGAFRSSGDADTLKAQLAMLGVESKIVPISNEEGTKYKVRIGPIDNSREMNRTRNRLNSNSISTIVLREQKPK